MSEQAEQDRGVTGARVDRLHEDRTSVTPPLGFIGLGMMGLPMAVSVVRAGHPILACDVDAGRLSLLVEACEERTIVHTTPVVEEVGERCAVVALMLPTSLHVDAVVQVLRTTLAPGGVIVDMGSSIPSETKRLAAELAGQGLRFVDAPVSGGVVKAQNGTLAILVGGADADVEVVMPYLKSMGEAIIRTGPVGSGHAMKALNNFVYAAGLLAASEALRLGEAAGLDLAILADVLNASSGRNTATETKVKQFILPGTYAGGFRLGLMAKDIETAASIAEETGVVGASLATCQAVWRRALEALGPDVDNTEIHRFIGNERNAR